MSSSAAHRPRLVNGSFALVLGSELGMLTSFFLLVSVTPMAAAAGGSGSAGAGLATGVLLLGTVLAELASPVLMRRCGYRAMLAAGALLMGASSLVMLAHGALTITIIASLARGFGFGLGTVVLGALAALLVPADRRGEGLGLFDVIDTLPGVVALPAGVVVSFLPLATGLSRNIAAAGLFAQALTSTAGSWGAGRLGDRIGHARLLAPALAIATAGMAGLLWLASPVAVIAGMAVFGLGFGILQNSTFTLMISQLPESQFGTASAIWSLAYDAGFGAGPVAFGVFVGVTGYPVAFALSALMMVVALPLARKPRPGAAAPGPDPAAVVAAVSAPAGTAGSCR